MKITGTLEETIVIEKFVAFEVPDDTDPDEFEQLIRDKAYEATLFQGEDDIRGWELTGSGNVEITVISPKRP